MNSDHIKPKTIAIFRDLDLIINEAGKIHDQTAGENRTTALEIIERAKAVKSQMVDIILELPLI